MAAPRPWLRAISAAGPCMLPPGDGEPSGTTTLSVRAVWRWVQMLRRCHAKGQRLDEVESDLEVIEPQVLRLAAAIEVLDAQLPIDP